MNNESAPTESGKGKTDVSYIKQKKEEKRLFPKHQGILGGLSQNQFR